RLRAAEEQPAVAEEEGCVEHDQRLARDPAQVLAADARHRGGIAELLGSQRDDRARAVGEDAELGALLPEHEEPREIGEARGGQARPLLEDRLGVLRRNERGPGVDLLRGSHRAAPRAGAPVEADRVLSLSAAASASAPARSPSPSATSSPGGRAALMSRALR